MTSSLDISLTRYGYKVSPRIIRGELYVPVRPLAGPAFRARKDGFDLDRGGVPCRFTAKDRNVQAGKVRFFVDAEPEFVRDALAKGCSISPLSGTSQKKSAFPSIT